MGCWDFNFFANDRTLKILRDIFILVGTLIPMDGETDSHTFTIEHEPTGQKLICQLSHKEYHKIQMAFASLSSPVESAIFQTQQSKIETWVLDMDRGSGGSNPGSFMAHSGNAGRLDLRSTVWLIMCSR
jgi:hypothetical protein